MNTVTLQDYREHPALSFELYQQARHERARAISRLSASLAARVASLLSALRRPAPLGAHWG